MAPGLYVQPQGRLGQWLDHMFEGIMRHVSGAPEEGIQKTHFWNNHHLGEQGVRHLRTRWMVSHPGDPEARTLPPIPLAHVFAHATRYGGWRRYLVLEPVEFECSWHVGWWWDGGAGVSRIAAQGPLRVLVGPRPCRWFGISAEQTSENVQLPIAQRGEGVIGRGGEFAHLPLF